MDISLSKATYLRCECPTPPPLPLILSLPTIIENDDETKISNPDLEKSSDECPIPPSLPLIFSLSTIIENDDKTKISNADLEKSFDEDFEIPKTAITINEKGKENHRAKWTRHIGFLFFTLFIMLLILTIFSTFFVFHFLNVSENMIEENRTSFDSLLLTPNVSLQTYSTIMPLVSTTSLTLNTTITGTSKSENLSTTETTRTPPQISETTTTTQISETTYTTQFLTTITSPLPLITSTLFYQRENKIFGNLNYFMNESRIISPFGIDYILSFIGNLGSEKDKLVVSSYFGEQNVAGLYEFYKNIKKMLFKKRCSNFMLSSFITGKETEEFMVEQSSFDDVAVYPASDRSYSYYFNEMFRKRSYDIKKNKPFFQDENITTPEETVIGFSHIQQSLRFNRVRLGLVKNQIFYGINKQKYVNRFIVNSFNSEFGSYRLHAIPFTNPQIHMFIIENLKDISIPLINPLEILNNLKIVIDPIKAKPYTPVCIPEIYQQNTVDFSMYFKETLKDKLSIYSPFNATSNGYKYNLAKFYQALRFDVSVEGINIAPTTPYENISLNEAITFNKCKFIDNPFTYGLVFKTNIFIYYGVFA